MADIRDVVSHVDLCVIGLLKAARPGLRPLISPTLDDARAVVAAGAHIVALDLSYEAHPEPIDEFVARVRASCRVPVLADVSTMDEATRAMAAGADAVATTLAGYTPHSGHDADEPDFALLASMVAAGMPAALEGRIHDPDHARRAFDMGAIAAIVGAAITDPAAITRRYDEARRRTASVL